MFVGDASWVSTFKEFQDLVCASFRRAAVSSSTFSVLVGCSAGTRPQFFKARGKDRRDSKSCTCFEIILSLSSENFVSFVVLLCRHLFELGEETGKFKNRISAGLNTLVGKNLKGFC